MHFLLRSLKVAIGMDAAEQPAAEPFTDADINTLVRARLSWPGQEVVWVLGRVRNVADGLVLVSFEVGGGARRLLTVHAAGVERMPPPDGSRERPLEALP